MKNRGEERAFWAPARFSSLIPVSISFATNLHTGNRAAHHSRRSYRGAGSRAVSHASGAEVGTLAASRSDRKYRDSRQYTRVQLEDLLR